MHFVESFKTRKIKNNLGLLEKYNPKHKSNL